MLGVTLAKLILLAAVLQATPPVEQLFPARPSGYVTDVARVLDTASVEGISGLIERLRSATGAEIAVVVLPTIGDRAPVDVAVAIGRAWGVGAQAAVGDPRRNTGIVVLLVPRRADDPNSGHVFIATGQGVEGYVTDLQAGRVRDLMIPYFRDGDYAAGLEAGVRELSALVAQGMGVADTALTRGARQAREGGGRGSVVFMLLAVFFTLLVIAAIAQRAQRVRYGPGRRRRRRRGDWPGVFWGGFGGGGGRSGGGSWGGFGGGGFGGGGFGGFGGGGGFSGGGAGGRF
ncbi:MAG: TPM domain-containing protein [Gemmatimonadales bacterium]